MTYEEWLELMHEPFPRLSSTNSRLTSPIDEGYNCIAWAAEDTYRRWWPDPLEQCYWPAGAPREVTIHAFVRAYAILGYSERSNASLERDKQKIAVFVNNEGIPTHAARQLPNGWWTSKLGEQIDIEHDLLAVEEPIYGKVEVVLARKL